VLVTAVALALLNAGLALLIVAAIGARSFAPLWLAALLLVLGIPAAVGAVQLWRSYLKQRV
jgi:hypothetical protein